MLHRAGDLWQGRLPKSIHVANTALEWSGVRWTMVMWPLPADTRERAQLLAHECYHRIQPAIKLPANDAVNGHLDGAQGRIWMLLEWRALERALLYLGEARKTAIADALRFRRYRRSLIKNSPDSENQLEMNEGLAEYTGVRLQTPIPPIVGPPPSSCFMADRDGLRWFGPSRTPQVPRMACCSTNPACSGAKR